VTTSYAKKVLLINDQQPFLESCADYLKVDQGLYHLILATSGREALDILNREEVALILYDRCQSDPPGFDVMAEIQSHWPRIKTFSMKSLGRAPTGEEKRGTEGSGFDQASPGFEWVRQRILEEIIKKEEGFEGTLKNFQLADLIQMCCLSGVSSAIRVSQDSQDGIIFVKNGEIIHATCKEITGEEAFYQIISWKRGSFESWSIHSFPEPTIEKNWEFLLMEGARMSDEQATTDSRPSTGRKGASASLSEAQVRVLIVDDSPWMCRILEELLSADEEIKVVGVAHDGREALRKIDELKPTLITLDVNMPGMDGGTALRHIMIRNPCPIVIISSLGSKPSTKILDFLRLGAVDFVLKPKKGEEMVHQQRKLIERIKQAATAKTGNFRRVKPPDIHLEAKGSSEVQNPCEGLVVMASGGGGYAELIRIFPLLPKDLNVSYLVLQDTSPELLVPLSEHLDLISKIDVQPLQNRAPLSGRRCYIGTSDTPTRIASMDGRYFLQLGNGLLGPSFHPEPFDSLLSSLAETFFDPVLVVLLSGATIGNLDGLGKIRQRKARIIAQQLDSCLLPHSLQRAIDAHMVDSEATHEEIARQIRSSMGQSRQGLQEAPGMHEHEWDGPEVP
jgi:two-component system, chemotaxis family, protein-glutamate methylesterase/glutaminase